jgi:hypothetical protein
MANSVDLADFGPFVHLFVPWMRVSKGVFGLEGMQGYCGWLRLVLDVLRAEFMYVTLSQDSSGVPGNDDLRSARFTLPRNVFVLSAGGRGHVLLLSVLKEMPLDDCNSQSFVYRF